MDLFLGERLYLIAMIDDANSRAMAQFADQDSVEENLRVGGDEKTCSRPAYSTDFRVNSSLKSDVESNSDTRRSECGVDLRGFSPGWIRGPGSAISGENEVWKILPIMLI